MIVSKQVSFDAAHYLPNYEGKCKNVHGHHWVVELALRDEVKEDGMVVDFASLTSFLNTAVVERFDHKLLNDEIPNPTAENICLFIRGLWNRFHNPLFFGGTKLTWIKVWETEDSYAMLEPM